MSYDHKNLRDFNTIISNDNICPLCNISNKDCLCIKHNCKCKIIALKCIWPDCVCSNCLQMQDECVCINEQ